MSNQLTQQDYKHREELFMISAVLHGNGLSEENCICSDRPDIQIRLNEKDIIGVEVVTYRSGNNAEAENALNKILYEYGKIIDKILEKRYVVSVFFYGAELPTNLNYKRMKNEIFEEIEKCRQNAPDKIYNKYIEDVDFDEAPFMEESFVSCVTAFLDEDTDEHKLMRIIEHKGKKLKHYKLGPENTQIREWWLVIFFPTIEHTDFRNFQLSQYIQSDYDHIFLSELSNNYMQIK